jgi:hypothetical protein
MIAPDQRLRSDVNPCEKATRYEYPDAPDGASPLRDIVRISNKPIPDAPEYPMPALLASGRRNQDDDVRIEPAEHITMTSDNMKPVTRQRKPRRREFI